MKKIPLMISLGLLLGFMNVSAVMAAPVNIETCSVNYFNFTGITLFGPVIYEEDPVYPAMEFIMGEYTEPPMNGTTGIAFAEGFGFPPPSGTVDADTGSIDMDLRSLRLYFYYDEIPPYIINTNFAAWNGTSPFLTNTYNPLDHSYALEWQGETVVPVSGLFPLSVSYTINLKGVAQIVPVPGAITLLFSGFLGLAGFLAMPGRKVEYQS